MKQYTATIHHELPQELHDRWQKLWDESEHSHFHNSPGYFFASRDGFAVKKFVILTIEHDGQLEAIFPLVREKRFGVTVLCNPGERFTDKSTLLLRQKDSELIKQIITKLMEVGNFYLEELSEDVADMMLQVSHFLIKQKASVNPYLPLQPDPYRFMRSKTRNQMRNTLEKYKTNLKHSYFVGDKDALEQAFAVDAISTKRSRAKSDLAREREREFFRQILHYNKEQFFVDLLSFDNKPFVYLIGVIYKKTYHAWLTAFDGEYKFLSPGKLLFFTLFERLAKEGFELVDFSRGETYVKQKFTHFQTQQYDIIFAKNTMVQYWWNLTNFLYNFIVGNRILYGTYRIGKKIFYR